MYRKQPSDWKRGDWTAVYKKDDKLSKENYQPITILLCINKITEKLVGSQISAGFDSHMYENSNGYRRHHSCETTLINLIESWRKARDDKLVVNILSTDMSKAFDSLHPPLLLSKLKAYGFQESLIQLLNSYLCDRYNRVEMGNEVSSNRLVNRGCPQGSALGPLSSNIFQNDLHLCISTDISMFADDHQMYHSGHNHEEITSKLSASADQGNRWYKSNLLVRNLKKYQTLNISYRTKTTGPERASGGIRINSEEIKTAETIKLLGVTDSRLNFSEHVKSARKKASQRIAVLMRLRNGIPIKAKLQLYKAAVLLHLTYCHLVWHFFRASDSRKLEQLQDVDVLVF